MNRIAVTMKGKPITLIGKTTRKGEEALRFYGMGRQLETISLEDFKNKNVLITSFLSVDIPACAAQLHRLDNIAKSIRQRSHDRGDLLRSPVCTGTLL